jgi:hypothetical protein
LDDVHGLTITLPLCICLSCRLKHQLGKMLISFQSVSADLIQLVKEVVSFSALDLTFIDVIVPVCVNKIHKARLISAAYTTSLAFHTEKNCIWSKFSTDSDTPSKLLPAMTANFQMNPILNRLKIQRPFVLVTGQEGMARNDSVLYAIEKNKAVVAFCTDRDINEGREGMPAKEKNQKLPYP